MPIIRSGKELVGGSRNGKALQYVYVGNKLAWSAGPRFPVAYNATGGGNNRGGSGTMSWTHNSSGDDRAVLVLLSAYHTNTGTTTDITSVQYGSTVVPRLGVHQQGSYARMFIYGMLNPPTGNQTVSVSCSASNSLAGFVGNTVSYTNVADFGAITLGPTGNSSGTFNMVVPANDLQMIVAAWGMAGNSYSNFSHNERWNNTSGSNRRMLIGDAPGAAPSVTVSVDKSQSGSYGGMAINLLPKN